MSVVSKIGSRWSKLENNQLLEEIQNGLSIEEISNRGFEIIFIDLYRWRR